MPIESQQDLETIKGRVADEASWPPADSPEALAILRDGIVAYGITSDEARIPPLMRLYKVVSAASHAESRLNLYHGVRRLLVDGFGSVNTFMPFLMVETHGPLVAEATIDICMMGGDSKENPLAVPTQVSEWLLAARPANRGAMFAGLVYLGDARVHQLLRVSKWMLSDREVQEAQRCRTQFAKLATIYFWLGWLEEMAENALDEGILFASAASALAELARCAEHGVDDIERNFGYLRRKEPPQLVRYRYTKSQVADIIGTRLKALEDAEHPPKVMPDVLTAWGLDPMSALDQRHVLQ